MKGGNTAEVDAQLEVIDDTEAPVIDGVAPLTGFIGDPISYKSEITVTDNCDPGVELEVDNSEVNPGPGGHLCGPVQCDGPRGQCDRPGGDDDHDQREAGELRGAG